MREKQVNQLTTEKEALFLTKYDLERKLSEMAAALQLAQTSEEEAVSQMKAVQKRYDAKVAECESLIFRLKHLEDLSQMMDPPANNSFPKLIVESPANHTIDSSLENRESERLKALETANKLLENELELMKEALRKQ